MIDPIKRRYRALLRRVGRCLYRLIGIHPSWHGGTPGKSSFTSARKHEGCRFLVTRDVSDCFASVSPDMLEKALRRLGASPQFGRFLARLMTVRGRIPQGGPLSNLALNLFFLRQDRHLHRSIEAKGGAYGRLTDDCVASVATREKALKAAKELDQAIEGRGLRVNKNKRRKRGLLAGDRPKQLHSLEITSRSNIRPKTEHKQKALSLAESYARQCRRSQPGDLERLAALRAQVSGYMYYMRQADRSPARHIRHMVKVADNNVRTMLRKHRLRAPEKWWKPAESRRLAQEVLIPRTDSSRSRDPFPCRCGTPPGGKGQRERGQAGRQGDPQPLCAIRGDAGGVGRRWDDLLACPIAGPYCRRHGYERR